MSYNYYGYHKRPPRDFDERHRNHNSSIRHKSQRGSRHYQDWYDEEEYVTDNRIHKKKDYYEELDGEPLNELELLALRNAAINKVRCKIAYTEQDDSINNPSNSNDNYRMKENNSVIENRIKTPELPNIERATPSTIENVYNIKMNPIENKDKEKEKDNEKQKKAIIKKRWPFSFLFKKHYSNTSNIEPSINTSQSPIPALSPDYSSLNSGSILSSVTSTASPFQQPIKPNNYWAFKNPLIKNQAWFTFDAENQKLLSECNNVPYVEIFDSNFNQKTTPLLAVPRQFVCYYPVDIQSNQFGYLELALLTKPY